MYYFLARVTEIPFSEKRWLQLTLHVPFDFYFTAISPRYDHSATYVTTAAAALWPK